MGIRLPFGVGAHRRAAVLGGQRENSGNSSRCDDRPLLVAGVALTALSVDALAVTARMAPLAGVPLAIMHAVAMATSPQGASAWAFVAAAGFIVVKQLRNDFVVDFNWVSRFETAHAWTLLAVFTLVAAVAVDGLRHRQDGPTEGPPEG